GKIEEPISMYCDNTGVIAIANESGVTKVIKAIIGSDVKQHSQHLYSIPPLDMCRIIPWRLSRINQIIVWPNPKGCISSCLFPAQDNNKRTAEDMVLDDADEDEYVSVRGAVKTSTISMLLQPRVVVYDGVCHLCHRGLLSLCFSVFRYIIC
nr:hypothetical protein [Tanacetum cinerariifolium]